MSPLNRALVELALILTSMLFINAGLINLVEDIFFSELSNSSPEQLTFGNALWLSLVTMATVGYGVSPAVTGVGVSPWSMA